MFLNLPINGYIINKNLNKWFVMINKFVYILCGIVFIISGFEIYTTKEFIFHYYEPLYLGNYSIFEKEEQKKKNKEFKRIDKIEKELIEEYKKSKK